MATPRWRPGAAKTTDEYTITIANTWNGSSDTITITDGNSHDVTLTPDSATIETIAQEVCNWINATNTTSNLVGAETRTAGCQSVPELSELIATVSGAVVTVKCKTPGKPVTFTVSESTAGTGTATKATVISATGPEFFDNAENWDTGSLPSTGDTIVFDDGDGDCLYGLDYMVANTAECIFWRTTDYEGKIGLDDYSPAGYAEYRAKGLQMYFASIARSISFTRGARNRKGGATRLNLGNAGSYQFSSLNAADAGDLQPNVTNLQVEGGTITGTMYLGRGRFVVGGYKTGSVGVCDTIMVGSPGEKNTEVFFDAMGTIGGTVTLTQRGGRCYHLTPNNGFTQVYHVRGGTFYAKGEYTATHAYQTVNIYGGGKVSYDTPTTATTVNLRTQGVLDFDNGFGSVAVTTLNVYGNSTVVDGAERRSGTVNFVGCKITETKFEGTP